MRGVLCTFVLAAVVAVPAAGQQRTLVDDGFDSGGFGAPVIKFANAVDQFAVYVGGRGGWIINSTIMLGLGGYGLASDVTIDPRFFGRQMEFGYGGLDLEFIVASDALVHATVGALVGGGGVRPFWEPTDAVFVLEPALNIELNMTSFMRLAVGGTYLWVTDIDTPTLRSDDLNSFTGTVQLKFGKF
jgi:hypothetical protein